VPEAVLAVLTSLLLHLAWFTLFLATTGLHSTPPWDVFAADPEAVEEL